MRGSVDEPPAPWPTPEPSLLERLRHRLGGDGLHIVLPVSAPLLDRALTSVRGPLLGELMEGASGAFVIGDGGPQFFAGFRRARISGEDGASSDANPLDQYTRRCVARAVAQVMAESEHVVRYAIAHPFDGGGPPPARAPLPFQRLGRAAGLPAPGPLGLQIHPVFGPWWAYRALVIVGGVGTDVRNETENEPPLSSSCDGCSAPCAAACPAQAVVAGEDFRVVACSARRLTDSVCARSCAARLACPVGGAHRYLEEQVDFHMAASLAQIRPRNGDGDGARTGAVRARP